MGRPVLPYDGCFPMLYQVFVGTAEMPVAEEAVVSRKRRGVDRCQYQVFVPVNESTFLLCI